MNRFSILLVPVLSSGCASSTPAPTPAVTNPAPHVAINDDEPRRLLEQFYAKNTALLWPRFSRELRRLVGSEAGISAMAVSLEQDLGGELEVVAEHTRRQADRIEYQRDVRYKHAPQLFSVVITVEFSGAITTFGIVPATPEAPTKHADVVSQARLRLPFDGEWWTAWGGRTTFDNHHAATVDQRFAYDFTVLREGRSHDNDGHRNEDYYCYGAPVLAPAAGKVVAAIDGVADNKPGEMNKNAMPGNFVVIDHGHDEFSFLAHLKTGSLRVRPGDRVSSGAELGLCGNSGNSSEPHLHYHLQDTATPFKGAGIPAWFNDVTIDGRSVERAEPVRGQTVRARQTGGQS